MPVYKERKREKERGKDTSSVESVTLVRKCKTENVKSSRKRRNKKHMKRTINQNASRNVTIVNILKPSATLTMMDLSQIYAVQISRR